MNSSPIAWASSRRRFLRTSLLGAAGVLTAGRWSTGRAARPQVATVPSSRVALTTGTDRAAVTFNGLNGYDWGAYCLGISGYTSYEYKIILNANGDGSVQIPFGDYTKVVLIPVVDEWVSSASNLTYTYTATLTSNPVDVAENSGLVPMNYRLFDPSPNPISSRTELKFQVPEAVCVSLKVFDGSGRVVRDLFEGNADVGIHTLTWDGRDDFGDHLANGLYFCTMTAGDYVGTSKLIMAGQ